MTECNLSEKRCVPCEGGVDKLTTGEIDALMVEIPKWSLDGEVLTRQFAFENFEQALAFTNQVGAVSEAEFHHPEITLNWGRVDLRVWTHAIDGLSENDFILAAKFDRL
jgi:4a-hydroxytetrahydrobiopterin dehydratase